MLPPNLVQSILTDMPVPRRLVWMCAAIFATALAGTWARADEIRLKDGQKLYGVIVAYEDNMFKVKTDFGFVLVEKDKIAAIIPSAPGGRAASKTEQPSTEKPAAAKPESGQAKSPAVAPRKEDRAAPIPTPAAASAKPATPANSPKSVNSGTNQNGAVAAPANSSASVSAGEPSSPAIPKAPPAKNPPTATSSAVNAPNSNKSPAKESNNGNAAPKLSATTPTTKPPAPSSVPVVTPVQPVKPREIEVPANRESLQGNIYTNFTHGFHMYKPPSWRLIEDPRKALPNAIVAMGTADESTLLVVGQEKAKDSLEVTAADVEKRLRDTYGNYRRISQRKTVAGGFPAVEIHYRGLADDHDWSGTLLVVGRGGDIFSVLGMTYANTDLIQIQENVISRAIASLEFNSN
jgi:hypothetical protein